MRCAGLSASAASCFTPSADIQFRHYLFTVNGTAYLCWSAVKKKTTDSLNSDGNPFTGGAKYTGEFAMFDWIRRLISVMVRYMVHGCYGTLIGSHRQQIDRCRFRYFEWPLTRTSGSLYRPIYKSNMSKTMRVGDKVTTEH